MTAHGLQVQVQGLLLLLATVQSEPAAYAGHQSALSLAHMLSLVLKMPDPSTHCRPLCKYTPVLAS